MNKVKVITAYVALDVRHLNTELYHAYGERLRGACDGRLRWFDNFSFDDLWLVQTHPEILSLPPAAPTPADRYSSDAGYVRSHCVNNARTQWALLAAEEDPEAEVIVWLDLAILKQGDFTGKRVTEDHIRSFLEAVERYDFTNDFPFPGISDRRGVVDIHGNNWRFCGSTHIWPVRHLARIDRSYRYCCLEFIRRNACVPLDLAVWPSVEVRSGLPFRWYPAEYDYTQLSNFPGVTHAP